MDWKKSGFLIFAGILWVVAIAVGGTVLLRYASTAGDIGNSPQGWPAASHLSLFPDAATLVLSVHPHCPCTRASVVELNDLMLALRGRLKAYVLVIKPGDFPEGWEKTDILSSAKRIPGVEVLTDLDGAEAAKFGARTSGQAMLFDSGGRLMFNGGITEGRGHIGDNPGLQRIISLVKTGKADKNNSLVFGCPLNAKSCPMEKADKSQEHSKGAAHDDQYSL